LDPESSQQRSEWKKKVKIMHRFEFSAGLKLAAILCGAAGITGCGVSKALEVHNVDSSALPPMPTPIAGQASIAGTVVDGDGKPIAGATIKVAETDATATADESGAYQMMVPSDSTLTLVAAAAGFATTYHDAIALASAATVTQLDLFMLPTSKIAGMNGLGAAGTNATAALGVVALRLHSVGADCVITGAHVSVMPAKAATVLYSLPGAAGGLDEPDITMTSVQDGTKVAAWLVGTLPPGNMLQIAVDQPGCHMLAQSPSMSGLQHLGVRRVDAQALTVADLFLN
jgi:hypothetical protein